MVVVLFSSQIQAQICSSQEKSLSNLQLRHKVSETITEVLDKFTQSVAGNVSTTSGDVQISSESNIPVANNSRGVTPETYQSAGT